MMHSRRAGKWIATTPVLAFVVCFFIRFGVGANGNGVFGPSLAVIITIVVFFIIELHAVFSSKRQLLEQHIVGTMMWVMVAMK